MSRKLQQWKPSRDERRLGSQSSISLPTDARLKSPHAMILLPPQLSGQTAALPLAIGIAAVFALVFLLGKKTSSSKTVDGKPLRKVLLLERSSAFVGDLFELMENVHRFNDWAADTCARLKWEPWWLRIPGQRHSIVLSTPDAVEDVLVTQFANFPHGEYFNSLMEGAFGKSILTFDGDKWHRQRKLGSKFFTAKALRLCMLKTVRKNMGQVYEALDKSIANEKPIDLGHLLMQFTLQTFVEVGLGVDDFRWIGKHENGRHPVEEVVHILSPAVTRRFLVPTFVWKLEKFFNVGVEKQRADTERTAVAWMSDIIVEALEAAAKKKVERARGAAAGEDDDDEVVKNVVELFFEQQGDDDDDAMSTEALTYFLMTFVFVAQDTSALTLSWIFLSLAKHPHIEQRLREEMAQVLPKLGVTNDSYITTDHVRHLVYLEATIREVLRLYSVVPKTQREAKEDTIICGDIPVRKGDLVLMHWYAMARNPNVWGPDAAELKPERWIDPQTGELINVPPTKFTAFGAGPRICVGMKLGMMELRVAAANLLHRYRFSLAAPNDCSHTVGITLGMTHPLIVQASSAF